MAGQVIDRNARTDEVVDQIANVVEEHDDRIEALEDGGVTGAGTEVQVATEEVTITVRYMGQDEGQVMAKVGTTIREALAQLGQGYEALKNAKLNDRVVPVDTRLMQDAVVEPTPQGGKVG